MQWDPKAYGGVDSLRVGTNPYFTQGYGWQPDIVIIEDAGSGFLSNTKYTDYVVNYTGECYNDIFGEILVTFNPVIDYYPFDR